MDTTPVLDDEGRLFVASYKDGLYALDAETGDVQWNTRTDGLTGLMARGQVLFATGDDRVSAYHIGDGPPRVDHGRGRPRAAQARCSPRGWSSCPCTSRCSSSTRRRGRKSVRWNPGKGVLGDAYWSRARSSTSCPTWASSTPLSLYGGPG